MTCEKRWDEMRLGEMRCEKLTWFEMRWSVECEVQVWSVKCGVWRVQCEVWGKSSLGVALHRGRAQVMFLDYICATASQSTHARAWLAHSACKFYRWERSYSISPRQLPPRLVRVLLVLYIYIFILYACMCVHMYICICIYIYVCVCGDESKQSQILGLSMVSPRLWPTQQRDLLFLICCWFWALIQRAAYGLALRNVSKMKSANEKCWYAKCNWHVKCNCHGMVHSPSALTSVWSWHSSSGSSSEGEMLFPKNSKRSNCPFFGSFSATNAQIDLDGFSTVRTLEIRMKSSSISRIQHRETRRRSPTRRSHQPASGAPSWWPRWSNSGMGQVGALMGKMICLPISCGQYPKARSFCIWFILRWRDAQPFSNLCDFGLDVLQLIFDSFS